LVIERAATNTGELPENLHGIGRRLRQTGIDKRPVDAIAGFVLPGRAWRTARKEADLSIEG
jgi:hypothetical protein